jgi:hypothetical protein
MGVHPPETCYSSALCSARSSHVSLLRTHKAAWRKEPGGLRSYMRSWLRNKCPHHMQYFRWTAPAPAQRPPGEQPNVTVQVGFVPSGAHTPHPSGTWDYPSGAAPIRTSQDGDFLGRARQPLGLKHHRLACRTNRLTLRRKDAS